MKYVRLVQEFVRQFEEPQHLVVFTDSDHAGCLMTKNLTKTILSMDSKDPNLVTVKDLDSITKYNIKQLVDYLNKNKVLKQILIKEKFDVKAEVEEEKDDVMERDTFQTMNKLINDENEEETSLKGNMQVANERQLNVKDFNVEEKSATQ